MKSSYNDIANNKTIDELTKNTINLQNIEKLSFIFDDIKNKIKENSMILWKRNGKFS